MTEDEEESAATSRSSRRSTTRDDGRTPARGAARAPRRALPDRAHARARAAANRPSGSSAREQAAPQRRCGHPALPRPGRDLSRRDRGDGAARCKPDRRGLRRQPRCVGVERPRRLTRSSVGPFDDLWEAEQAAADPRRGLRLQSAVTLAEAGSAVIAVGRGQPRARRDPAAPDAAHGRAARARAPARRARSNERARGPPARSRALLNADEILAARRPAARDCRSSRRSTPRRSTRTLLNEGADRLRQTTPRVAARAGPGDGVLRVAVADPLATDPLDDLRLLFDGARARAVLAREPRDPERHQPRLRPRRRPRRTQLAEDADDDLDSLATEMLPRAEGPARLVRRRADHPARELAAAAGGEGARERHPHRALRARGARALPHRRRALRADAAPAPRAAGADRLAHQDHGQARHRREAPAAGRPHPAEDRRARLRRAALDAARSPTANAACCGCCRARRSCFDLEKIGFNPTPADGAATSGSSAHRTASSSSRARPAPARRRRSTPRSPRINRPDKNIITIEDPVEITAAGRQPDRGEAQDRPHLRDGPALDPAPGSRTSCWSARSATRRRPRSRSRRRLTGHLVFSTLHTNDAASAITRLVDMGVEPFLVGVVAGRGAGAAARPRALQELPRGLRADRRGARARSASSAPRPAGHALPRQRLPCTATTPATAAASASSS